MDKPILPYIRRAIYDIMEPDTFIKERVLFDYELLYVKEGTAIVTVEDRTYTGQVGDIFIFRPLQRHSIRVSAKSHFIQPHVHFDLLYRENRESIPISFKNLDEMSPGRYFVHFPSYLRPLTSMHIERLLFDLINEYDYPSRFHEERLTQLFLSLWSQILNEIS